MLKIKRNIIAHLHKILKIDKKSKDLFEEYLKAENFIPISHSENQDVFIASYPKSGVTWLQNLIAGVLLDTTSPNLTPKLVSEIVPDVHAKTCYKRIFKRMFFKTHFLPQPNYKKVIHLVRDGRDSLLSYYHYLKLNKNNGPTLEEMIKDEDVLWPCRWEEHTKQWNKNPYNAEILTIRYEDLLINPEFELRRIADFSNMPIQEQRLSQIIHSTRIDILRKKVSENGWDYDKIFGEDSPNFFRKGVSGEYLEEIDQELIEFFNSYSKEMLHLYNYEI